MDCGSVFVKYVLFIFNILFVVCGILLIVFGSLLVSNMGDIKHLDKLWEVNSGPILIIILGSIIFFVAFLGCCGAIRESPCCTLTYSIIMLVLFVCQVVLIVYVWSQKGQITAELRKVVDEAWAQHKSNPAGMDSLQISLKCCGNKSPADYTLNLDPIPSSCCGPKATSCGITDVVGTPGCSSTLVSFWEKNLDIIRYAGLAVCGIELVAFIFGFCLYNGIRNSDRRLNY